MIEEGFSSGDFVIKTAYIDVYDNLCGEEKQLFERKHHLFAFSLTYGLLLKITSEKSLDSDIVKIRSIKDEETLSVIDTVAYLLDDGKSDEKEIWKKMLQFADGGLLELKSIYDRNGNFTIPTLIVETQKKWPERAKELNNINFS